MKGGAGEFTFPLVLSRPVKQGLSRKLPKRNGLAT